MSKRIGDYTIVHIPGYRPQRVWRSEIINDEEARQQVLEYSQAVIKDKVIDGGMERLALEVAKDFGIVFYNGVKNNGIENFAADQQDFIEKHKRLIAVLAD